MFTTPKFCDWLKHEWLYSSIDKEIFLRFNDFQLILREHFPTLKSRSLTRAHWSTIRRIIGKPRRFSSTFLSDERRVVQEKRKNIQYIQYLILTSFLGPMASEHLDNLLNCLPSVTRIPLRLSVGTRVCVCLCTPMQGLYLGLIQNSCPGDGYYAVWIEELIISNDYMEMKSSSHYGCQIVPEEDVFPLPNQPLPPCVTLSEIRNHFKENMINSDVAVFSSEFSSYKRVESSNNRSNCIIQSLPSSGPLLSGSICDTDHTHENSSQVPTGDLLIPQSQFNNSSLTSPCTEQKMFLQRTDHQAYNEFLIRIIKLYKILARKQSSIETLKQLNDTAEVMIAQEHNMMEVTSIIDWRRRCNDEAEEIVSRMKDLQTNKLIDDNKLDLVAKLISILVYLSKLSDHRYMNQIPACIDELIKDIKQHIHPNNVKCFESTVENAIGQILNVFTNAVYSRMYRYQPSMLNNQFSDNS
ncbi:Protein lin-9 isoform 1 [Schistosoma japonicum]|uniref:Protein lin-9 isoform 1 n=1 Tax=Schistosoma japonicum TaxID=6182 RepID=A0A4Z2DC33_SCHJA|nr:Protein lin-9 isoform 1 [Schistosoma japonicum]